MLLVAKTKPFSLEPLQTLCSSPPPSSPLLPSSYSFHSRAYILAILTRRYYASQPELQIRHKIHRTDNLSVRNQVNLHRVSKQYVLNRFVSPSGEDQVGDGPQSIEYYTKNRSISIKIKIGLDLLRGTAMHM